MTEPFPGPSLPTLIDAIRSGRLTPAEHVAQVLDRLAADPFNTVITLDVERATAAAAVLTDEANQGQWRGPLHGIALGVKDLIDVVGLPTRCGSNVLQGAPPASVDAPVVARLRTAGAVVVAKLHTQEFAHGPTGDVAATGPARNPHDPTRITGGSSSGSAAAVAAGYLPLALGTDTGCSVRTPAALCGVVGLKPTYGAVSTDGVFPLAETLDHVGLLTSDAAGAALAWSVLHGRDAAVPVTLDGLRIGVPVDDYWQPADPAIAPWPAAAVAALAAAGARVVEVRTPMIDELVAAYPLIVGNEAYTTHARWLARRPADYQPLVRERLLSFADRPAVEYIRAQRTRRRLVPELRAAVGDVDVLVLPTTRLRATPIGAASVPMDGVDVDVRPALLALNSPFNLSGWPAVSVPAPVDGLPIGVQIVGVGLDEHGILDVAAALERAWR
ncbi:amidase [Nakamurella sp.]|uniref:amidase n=1 Tax=Nakamurella sp. TaxID=1869182 RepID=UPI0037840569